MESQSLNVGKLWFSREELAMLQRLQHERMERGQNFDLCEVVKSLIHEALLSRRLTGLEAKRV